MHILSVGQVPLGVFMMKMKLVAFGILVGLMAVGCAGGDAGTGEGEGEGGGFDEAAFIDEFAPAITAAQANCDSPIKALEPSAGNTSLDVNKEKLRAILERAVEVDETKRAPCLAALAACEFGDNACDSIFVGTRNEDEGCVLSDECAEGLICSSDGTQCGKCVARAEVGAACELDRDCEDGLVCPFPVSTCTTALAANAACDPQNDLCGSGLRCRGDICKGDFVLGDACTVEQACGFLTGLACVNDACAAVTIVQPNGAACDADQFGNTPRYCIDQLTGDNNCIDEDEDGVGVCVTGSATGAACAATGCLSDVTCDDNVCVEKQGVGGACPTGFECKSNLECKNEVCAEPVNLICAE
jgi:hypothetical protein